jgi:predicted transcriptional regulator
MRTIEALSDGIRDEEPPGKPRKGSKSENLRVADCQGASYFTERISIILIDREETAVRKVQMVTDRELEILKILWVRGRASVREVQDDLNKSAGPVAYSTVQTLLNIMEDKKGLVRHVVEGRTFIYIPKKSSDRTVRELTRRFVDRVFDGCLDRVMVALLDSKPPTAAEFDRLRAMIDAAQRQSSAPSAQGETQKVDSQRA